jgi:hypothetical protein
MMNIVENFLINMASIPFFVRKLVATYWSSVGVISIHKYKF